MVVPLTENQLDNIQGDIWSKGFPKYYEKYYFFAINRDNAKLFPQCMQDLFTQSPPLISSLRKVKKDQADLQEQKKRVLAEAKGSGNLVKDVSLVPVANALIAFTRKGLDAVRSLLKVVRAKEVQFVSRLQEVQAAAIYV